MKAARFWHRREDGKVQCDLCPHRCALGEGRTGLCQVRGAREGELRALGYGLLSSANLDPIEKKPLHHFCPGSVIFSIGGWGCNFACSFCQNWTISQRGAEEARRFAPADVARRAGDGGSIGIAYTYNEPLINFEFVQECARLVREAGLANVLVTNGYVLPEPAAELLPLIDALNLDVKSMQEEFYRRQCRGTLQPVLDFAEQAQAAGCHLEITNLLIPGLNEQDENLTALSEWMRSRLGEQVPLHISAYHPQYQCTLPPTPPAALKRAYDICRQKLRFVYLGNVLTDRGQDTVCPQCGNVLIRRRGYATQVVGLQGGACARCGADANVRMRP